MSDLGLPVMKTSTPKTPEVLPNYNGWITNKIKIVYILNKIRRAFQSPRLQNCAECQRWENLLR